MSRFIKYNILLATFSILFSIQTTNVHSQDIDPKAYTLFLYNFMKYVEWPTTEGDFIIGVVGDSPIKTELHTLAKNKKVKGKQIVVISVSSTSDALLCNMIFIPAGKSTELKLISEKIKGKSILLVAEREGLAKKGAAISFFIGDDDSLKFDVNKNVIDNQSLKIAYILLQLGILVG